jgi:hypothetical protein
MIRSKFKSFTFTLRAERYVRYRYKKLFCEEILVLGDSHASIFSHKCIRSFFSSYVFNVVSVGGATVSGLQNPNSKTQALPIFIDQVKKSKAKTIIISLGEVDTGFVIWYRAEKYQAQVSEMLDNACRNYQELLSILSKTHRVICISTPLPTIRDGQDWGDIANARKDVKATQLQRTNLTIQFNRNIQEFCKMSAITYLDFDDESIGRNGLVDGKLLNQNTADHHYDSHAYAEMIIQKLKMCIEQSAAPDGSSAALCNLR